MIITEYYAGSKRLYKARFWYYKNGKKKSKSKSGFERKKAAESWADAEEKKLKGLETGADKAKVRTFLAAWLKKKKDNNKLSPTTASGYAVNIEHANKYIGDEIVSAVKRIDIQDMTDGLTAEGLKYRTVKYVVRTLHSAFNYAIEKGLTMENPCYKIDITEDDEPFEYNIYSPEDLGNLLIALREQKHWLYPPVLLASMRGLRRGECLGLALTDIDFKNGTAHIHDNYVVANKKKYHKKVKTKESNALIDISGFVADELKRIIEENRKNGIIQRYICEVNGKLPNPSHVSRALKRFQEANNLPVCRFHDLRHTFAMIQLEYGTDIETLKRLLRHSKIEVTEIYTHENLKMKRAASIKMDKIFSLKGDKSVTKTEKL